MLKAATVIFMMSLSLSAFSNESKKCSVTKTSFRNLASSELRGIRLSFEDESHDYVSFHWDTRKTTGDLKGHLGLELNSFEPDLSSKAFARSNGGSWREISSVHRIVGKTYLLEMKKLSEMGEGDVEIIIPVKGIPQGNGRLKICETWES